MKIIKKNLILQLLIYSFLITLSYEISFESRFKSSNYMNESSHSLNHKTDKLNNSIKIVAGFKSLTESFKNLSSIADSRNKLSFLNKSPVFHPSKTVNVTTNQGNSLKGDFTAKFTVNKLGEAGFSGIGLSSFKYKNDSEILGPGQWVGMIDYSEESNTETKKQWLLSDNFKIAENGTWKDNKNAKFIEKDEITLFRKQGKIGFRINDKPNSYKYSFDGPVYVVICLKHDGTEIESKSLIMSPLDFAKENDDNNSKVEERLKKVQQEIDGKELEEETLDKVMKSIFSPQNSTLGKNGVSSLQENSIINNKSILLSKNGVFSVEIRASDLQVIEKSGSPNEKVLWKSGQLGAAQSQTQYLGLLGQGTLYLKSEGKSDFYWTNKDRKKDRASTPPYEAIILDSGNFVVRDSNSRIIWETNTGVVSDTNSITASAKLNPITNGQCIVSPNRKSRLCNYKGKFILKNFKNEVKWKNYFAKDKTDPKMLLDAECVLKIVGKESGEDKAVWEAPTAKQNGANPSCFITVSDEGYLEVKTQSKGGSIIFSTNPLQEISVGGGMNNSNQNISQEAEDN